MGSGAFAMRVIERTLHVDDDETGLPSPMDGETFDTIYAYLWENATVTHGSSHRKNKHAPTRLKRWSRSASFPTRTEMRKVLTYLGWRCLGGRWYRRPVPPEMLCGDDR